MDDSQKDGFYLYIKKQAKEYVCANCGIYSMENKKTNFISSYEAEVTLKCKHCGWSKTVTMHKFD
jgi:RNase P subunit RPR2